MREMICPISLQTLMTESVKSFSFSVGKIWCLPFFLSLGASIKNANATGEFVPWLGVCYRDDLIQGLYLQSHPPGQLTVKARFLVDGVGGPDSQIIIPNSKVRIRPD